MTYSFENIGILKHIKEYYILWYQILDVLTW